MGGKPLTGDEFSVDEWPSPIPDEKIVAQVEPVVDDLLTKESLPAVEREQQERTVEITLDSTISFQPDSAALTGTAREGIAAIAEQVNEEAAPGSRLLVEGHVAGTDEGRCRSSSSCRSTGPTPYSAR